MGIGDEASRFTRQKVLIQQLNIIVHATTGSTTFREVIRKGIEHRWVSKVLMRGLTKRGRILQQLEIELAWKEHLLRIASIRYQLNQRIFQITGIEQKPNRISDFVGKVVEVFNEVNQEGEFKAEWVVVYTPGANDCSVEVNRILGLVDTEPRQWERGWEEPSSFTIPPELEELQVSWEIVAESTNPESPAGAISTVDP